MLDPEEIKRFEQKITEDKEFADEVAFYLSAKQEFESRSRPGKRKNGSGNYWHNKDSVIDI